MAKKILICDDEPHIRMLLEQTLEDLEDDGVELLLATNGQEGLDTILECKPDLVFLDVMMPFLSGFEVCERLRNDHGLTDVKVVLLTAKGQDADREKGIAAGANEYMTKPFNPDDLYEFASEALGI